MHQQQFGFSEDIQSQAAAMAEEGLFTGKIKIIGCIWRVNKC